MRIDDGLAQSSIALIDFGSLSRGTTSDATCRDAVELASELARSSIVPPDLRQQTHDLHCRIYGGFRDRGGRPTPEYIGLLKSIGGLQGLERNVRTTVEISLNILLFPQDDLVATYRGGEQKMVDTCLAVDAQRLCAEGHATLTIVSNDDDFIPVLLSMSRSASRVQWLRKNRQTQNDALLAAQGVALLSDASWL